MRHYIIRNTYIRIGRKGRCRSISSYTSESGLGGWDLAIKLEVRRC